MKRRNLLKRRNHMNRRLVFVLAALFIAVPALLHLGCSEDSPTDPGNGEPPAPKIWYVDVCATGAGSGTSWTDAFTHPADAMAAAAAGEQIWVAEGNYYGPGDKATPIIAFKAGVSVYGGFAGTETNLSQREWNANRTTFNGGDSLYHVVVGADNALLHGFIVTNGKGSGSGTGETERGAGVYCKDAKMRIAHCRFEYNSTGIGAGIYAENDTVVIDTCTFHENYAHTQGMNYGGGGGVALVNTSVPAIMEATITGCRFTQNSSLDKGGGLLLYNVDATVTETLFHMNVSNNNGGGAYIACNQQQSLKPEFYDCRFSLNDARYGAGTYLYYADTYFGDCEFEENSCTMTGAALYAEHSGANMEHCWIKEHDKNAVYNHLAGNYESRFHNCLFENNDAGGSNGGALHNDTASPRIKNCTFVGNSAAWGGAINNHNGSIPIIVNCILWGNASTHGASQINNCATCSSNVTYCNIDEPTYLSGTGNIRQDPLWVSGPEGSYYLSQMAAGQGANSPCVDAGDDTAIAGGLHMRTTRTDGLIDANQVDMGYHYDP